MATLTRNSTRGPANTGRTGDSATPPQRPARTRSNVEARKEIEEEMQAIKTALDGREYLEKYRLHVPAGKPPTPASITHCLNQIAVMAGNIPPKVVAALRAAALLVKGMKVDYAAQTLHKLIVVEIGTFTEDINSLVQHVCEKLTEEITTWMKSIDKATLSFTQAAQQAPANQIGTQVNNSALVPMSYSQAAMLASSAVDPMLIAKQGIQRRQFLVEGIAKNSKVGGMDNKKAIVEVNRILEEIAVDKVKAHLMTRRSDRGWLLEMNSDPSATWMETDGNGEHFCKRLSNNAHIKPRMYRVIALNCPLTAKPEDDKFIKEIEEQNGLDDRAIKKMKWVKPVVRRSSRQKSVHIILLTTDPKFANRFISSDASSAKAGVISQRTAFSTSDAGTAQAKDTEQANAQPLKLGEGDQPFGRRRQVQHHRAANTNVTQQDGNNHQNDDRRSSSSTANDNNVKEENLANNDDNWGNNANNDNDDYVLNNAGGGWNNSLGDTSGWTMINLNQSTIAQHDLINRHDLANKYDVSFRRTGSDSKTRHDRSYGSTRTSRLSAGTYGKLTIFNIYNPINSRGVEIKLDTYLRDNAENIHFERSDHVVWAGDFNRHHQMWDKAEDTHLFTRETLQAADHLIDALIQHGMIMALPPGIPTLQHMNLITKCDIDVDHQLACTDHLPIVTTIDLPYEKADDKPTKNFHSADWDKFNKVLEEELGNIPPPSLLQSAFELDIAATTLTTALQNAIQKAIKDQKPLLQAKRWWNDDLEKLRKIKNKLSSESYRWRVFEDHLVHAEKRRAIARFKKAVEKAKKTHWEDFLQDISTTDIWTAHRYVKEPPIDGGRPWILTLKTTDNGAEQEVTDNREKAETFAKAFFPPPPVTSSVPKD
ncbi:unnamed protein product [Cyclocybe aegerita]|uniref:Endonuclease/exonuclease/phosphatase domain-containing protein n=1 Tax=Cyclocybe aegerita TaxID=1973307 RepID=A0A8S0WE78_CYCAE|nr:unnamed protein product [Cyclocybe aegerita]